MRRVLAGSLLAVIAACGGASESAPPAPPVAASGSPPPAIHSLRVAMVGAGRVVSADGGLDCPSECTLARTAGTTVSLEAVAAAGSHFAGWSGACSGATSCSVALTGDADVTATFDVDVAPPPATHSLGVAVSGNGRVVSTPAGIDCPGVCTASFPGGSKVELNAGAGAGSKLDGFSGACSAAACSVTMNVDASVSASFSVAAGNAPPESCDGLVPESLPAPVVPPLTCNGGCIRGTSDDGDGNFALYQRLDPHYPGAGWSVVQVRGGRVVLSKFLKGGDQSRLSMLSQPSGFSMLDQGYAGGSLYQFANDGTATGGVGLGTTGFEVAVDPGGGFSAVSHHDSRDNPTSTYTFGRYDKNALLVAGGVSGSKESVDTVFADDNHAELLGVGMTSSHHSLVFFQLDHGASQFGLWVDENGARMSEPFNVPGGGMLQFLLDGSLLERRDGAFTAVWKDAARAPSPLPDWLRARANGTWLFPIRGGKGYAVGGTCAGIEVLTRSGNSCGCFAVPGVSQMASIGRDGSLIVPMSDHYELYPALFH